MKNKNRYAISGVIILTAINIAVFIETRIAHGMVYAPRTDTGEIINLGQSVFNDYKDLTEFALERDFRVTADIQNPNKHNEGSLHPKGLAIDVSIKGQTPEDVEEFMLEAKAAGLRVLDERCKPKNQKKWDGSHLHIEISDKPSTNQKNMCAASRETPAVKKDAAKSDAAKPNSPKTNQKSAQTSKKKTPSKQKHQPAKILTTPGVDVCFVDHDCKTGSFCNTGICEQSPPSPTPAPEPEPTPAPKGNMTLSSATCIHKEGEDDHWNKGNYVQTSGTMKGPVGTYMEDSGGSRPQECGGWHRGCIRQEGDPEESTWTFTQMAREDSWWYEVLLVGAGDSETYQRIPYGDVCK